MWVFHPHPTKKCSCKHFLDLRAPKGDLWNPALRCAAPAAAQRSDKDPAMHTRSYLMRYAHKQLLKIASLLNNVFKKIIL